MAAELLNALGPRANHAHLYNLGGSPFSLVTTPAPAQGNYRLRANGADNTRRTVVPTTSFTAKAYVWVVLREWRQAATMTTGNIAGILGWSADADKPFEIVAVGQSGGGWKLRLRDYGGITLADGTTLYSTGATDRDFRVTHDGTNCIVEVDGVVEITYATTAKPPGRALYVPASAFSGQDTFWDNFLFCHSDDEDDRPAVEVEIEKHVPNSNPGTNSDYGDQADCTDGSLGHYENWDDYNGSGGVNTADYNCADWVSPGSGGTRGDEQSGLTNATHSNPTIIGVVERAWCQQSAATKIRHRGSLYYGGTFLGIEMAQFVAQTTWDEFGVTFPDPPGGGAWSQTILDGMDGGHGRLTTEADSYLHASGLAFESVSITADPPAVEAEGAALLFSPVM